MDPEGWLDFMIETILGQLDLSSNTLMSDFESKNYLTMAHVIQELRNTNTPVCTTMTVDNY